MGLFSGRFANIVQTVYAKFVSVHEVRPPWHTEKHDLVVIESSDSVGVIMYNPDDKTLLLVRQKRAPMITTENQEGWIEEIPAGRMDRVRVEDLLGTVIREVYEETGISLEVDKVNSVLPALALSPGILTERMTFVFVIVRSPKHGVFGNAEEGEQTHTVSRSVREILAHSRDAKTVLAALYCFYFYGE